MTKAKEQGITTEKTFLLFTLGNPKTYITSQTFQNAIIKLASQHAFMITKEEIHKLMKRFDLDGDGMISLLEFKYYCLTKINSVAWKAERQRLERTGEMQRLRDRMNVVRKQHVSRYNNKYPIETAKEENSSRINASSPTKSVISKRHWNLIKKSISSPILKKMKAEPVPCGEAVFNTTKLFWRQNIKLFIRMFYCEPLDIITIQFSNDTDGNNNMVDESICLYVRKCDCPIKESDVEEATLALRTSSISSSPTLLLPSPRPFSNGFNNISSSTKKQEVDHLTVKKRVEWALYGNYVLARLRLETIADLGTTDTTTSTRTSTTSTITKNNKRCKYHVILTKLTGDIYDTLSVNRPIGLGNPRKSLLRSSKKQNRNSMMEEFEMKAKAANDALQEIHTSCRNLKNIRGLLDDAMDELDNLAQKMEVSSIASTTSSRK